MNAKILMPICASAVLLMACAKKDDGSSMRNDASTTPATSTPADTPPPADSMPPPSETPPPSDTPPPAETAPSNPPPSNGQ